MSAKKTIPSIEFIYLDVIKGKEEDTNRIIEEVESLIEGGVFLARDLVNEPAMYMTPKTLANNAKEELEKLGVKVNIYGREKNRRIRYESFLSSCQRF